MSRAWTTLAWCVTAIGIFWAVPTRAADTIEPFDPGLSDVELYTGYEGLGLDRGEQGVFAENVLGYGVTPQMSLYLAPSFAADGYLANATHGFELGAFGTPLDTSHVDVDVGLGVATDGETLAYAPYFELNLDLEPDLTLAGLYLRGGIDLYGAENDQGQAATMLGANGTLGAYVTIAGRHQLLAEVDSAWATDPGPDAPHTEVGALHLGYNFQLLDHLELINEVSVDIPQTGERPSVGFFVGVLAGLASAP